MNAQSSEGVKVDPITRQRQSTASSPSSSAWVSANAGSGKTYVLTQRVVRLLLAGFDPSRILCLTFTKSAAAEMSNRVFETLSNWAMMDEEKLTSTLEDMTGEKVNQKLICNARRLFARALETPGGLKIQTIHAFCEALLHQFPLEANIAGHFEILDERAQTLLIEDARQEVVVDASKDETSNLGRAFDHILQTASDHKIEQSFREIVRKRHSLNRWFKRAGGVAPAMATLRKNLNFAPDDSPGALIDDAYANTVLTPHELTEIADAGDATGVTKNQKFAAGLRAIAGAETGETRFELLQELLLTQSGTLRKTGGLYTSTLSKQVPHLMERFDSEMAYFQQVCERLHLLRQIKASEALFTIAEAMIGRFEVAKKARGLLDFDDLIIRTAELLGRSGACHWVQYKLDQGIDHVLVDEAQDTNPHQWQVITALVEDFFSGAGAREIDRTVFAVGDEKQSIYSFQGAQPAAFADQRDRLTGLANKALKPFANVDLQLSFRSVPDVLSAVDRVFSYAENYAGLGRDSQPTAHTTIRQHYPGMVDIWPMLKKQKQEEPEEWHLPVDQMGRNDPQAQLAVKIADQIGFWLENNSMLEGKGQDRINRPVTAGDILVLVRSRDRFSSALTRELKQRNIAVAGSDRLKLTDHIAVQDLLALARVILLPQDDLSLAAVLKSPLFGFDEELLLELAWDRGNKSLYQALAELAEINRDAKQAFEHLQVLHKRADNLRVHEFYSLLLGVDKGRQKFLARLGPEAADVLDAFLAQTLDFENSALPGLENFVDWLQSAAPEIKREFDQKVDEVKIMTVHGAKGLEAPVVFLVDKGEAPYHGRHDPSLIKLETLAELEGEATPYLWVADKSTIAPICQDVLAENKIQAEAEYQRLLYVAMTRAEDRLIVCGTSREKGPNVKCWHSVISHALIDDCQEHLDENGDIAFYRWQQSTPSIVAGEEPESKQVLENSVEVPDWIDKKLPKEPGLPRPLTPSGAQALIDAQDWSRQAASPLSDGKESNAFALQRGTAIHRLLQTLPEIGNKPTAHEIHEQRYEAAARYMTSCYGGWEQHNVDRLLAQVFSILEDPDFGYLFQPEFSRAEVALSGMVELGGNPRLISGQIDRLVVENSRVTIIDYKTNRIVPDSVDEIPDAYLSQLALYQLLASRIYPNHTVECALLWTETPSFMIVPPALLAAQLAKIEQP